METELARYSKSVSWVYGHVPRFWSAEMPSVSRKGPWFSQIYTSIRIPSPIQQSAGDSYANLDYSSLIALQWQERRSPEVRFSQCRIKSKRNCCLYHNHKWAFGRQRQIKRRRKCIAPCRRFLSLWETHIHGVPALRLDNLYGRCHRLHCLKWGQK